MYASTTRRWSGRQQSLQTLQQRYRIIRRISLLPLSLTPSPSPWAGPGPWCPTVIFGASFSPPCLPAGLVLFAFDGSQGIPRPRWSKMAPSRHRTRMAIGWPTRPLTLVALATLVPLPCYPTFMPLAPGSTSPSLGEFTASFWQSGTLT